MTNLPTSTNSTQSARLLLAVILTAMLFSINRLITGSWPFPSGDKSILYQNGLLLIAFGSLLFESKFTKPLDAFNNSFVVILTLLSVDPSKMHLWNAMVAYCSVVMLLASGNIFFGERALPGSKMEWFAKSTFRLSSYLGRAKRIFSLVFLCSLVSFYSLSTMESKLLLLFWGAVMLIEPLKIAKLIQQIFFDRRTLRNPGFGELVKLENPNVVICRVVHERKPNLFQYFVVKLPTGRFVPCISVGEFVQDKDILIKGIVLSKGVETEASPNCAEKSAFTLDANDFQKAFGQFDFDRESFLGFVCENSTIGKLVFEHTSTVVLEEGCLVKVSQNGLEMLYQVVEGRTNSEMFEGMEHGFMKVEAVQVGIWSNEKNAFEKYGWVPPFNTPVHLQKSEFNRQSNDDKDFLVGVIPNSDFPVYVNIDDLILHHVAISGVTGSGKTTLALNITNKILERNYKVFCVDISGDYEGMLKDLNPVELTLSEKLYDELARALEDVETGEYGAANEKRILNKLEKRLRDDISEKVKSFISGSENLALLQLKGISNTSANIFITEIYLSAVFEYAKKNRSDQKYCIVLEEAHTIIPEVSTLGVSDKFSKSIVGKMSQIALQGRKYNVGLMVLTQRTANVTKTILTQCNSVVVFALYDQTSLDFFSNHFDSTFINAIPNLKPHHAIVSGKGVKSARPLIMKSIPPRGAVVLTSKGAG